MTKKSILCKGTTTRSVIEFLKEIGARYTLNHTEDSLYIEVYSPIDHTVYHIYPNTRFIQVISGALSVTCPSLSALVCSQWVVLNCKQSPTNDMSLMIQRGDKIITA